VTMIALGVMGLVCSVAAAKPKHIVALLIDDYGWADAGWHRPTGYTEVSTPNMDALVKEGVEMDRHYVYKFCSPTRSAVQTGRNPIHVNSVNLDPNNYNPKDNVSGFSAVPRNMTGLGELMKRGGYSTHFFGKWDCGMATMEHTPRGRGYDTSLHYFHHMEDYWQSWFQNGNGNTKFFKGCSEAAGGDVWLRDLWLANATYEGPAVNAIDSATECSVGVFDLCSIPQYAPGGSCPPYPGFPKAAAEPAACTYVDETFTNHVIKAITSHDPTSEDPLFIFWAPHAIHSPLQVPGEFYTRFAHIDDFRRRRYHAMVAYIDTKVGQVVDALKQTGHFDDTVMFMSADNGGPIYGDGSAGANNYPLKGGKASNWEGGVRVNAWVSGGALPDAVRGTKKEGLSTIWDWWATFAAIGGINDIEDHKAKAAGLPPIDSINLWDYISGEVSSSPRTSVIIGDGDGEVGGAVLATPDGQIWKRLEGSISAAGWTGPQCPNATYHTPGTAACRPYCLFRLDSDPYEYHDLMNSTDGAATASAVQLKKLMTTAAASGFHPNRGGQDPASCIAAVKKWNNFWGPWVE